MKLIDDLDQLWNFWTTKLAAVASILGAVAIALPYVPKETAAIIPPVVVQVCQLCALLVTIGIIPARAIKQTPKP